MDEKIILSEINRRNTLSFEQAINFLTHKVDEQQKRIDALQCAINSMNEKMISLENMVILQKVKSMGTGPSVKD